MRAKILKLTALTAVVIVFQQCAPGGFGGVGEPPIEKSRAQVIRSTSAVQRIDFGDIEEWVVRPGGARSLISISLPNGLLTVKLDNAETSCALPANQRDILVSLMATSSICDPRIEGQPYCMLYVAADTVLNFPGEAHLLRPPSCAGDIGLCGAADARLRDLLTEIRNSGCP